MGRAETLLGLVACAWAGACGGDGTPLNAKPTIRFLHTFGPRETELFNAIASERGIAVESSLVPFARGQQVIATILRARKQCPDLVRIDATWLPALVQAGLLRPVPQGLVALDWTPAAAALARFPGEDGPWRAVPQSVDGLVVVRDRDTPAPAEPSDVDALIAAARRAKTAKVPYPLGVRLDGYWLVPWLRAAGLDLAPGAIGGRVDGADRPPDSGAGDREKAVEVVEKFAHLFGDLVPPPPPGGRETDDEVRRWQAHEVAYWVTGPWQLGGLGERDRIAISPLAHAPRGGQLLVVPVCSEHPDDGWALARELVDTKVAARFAELAVVPSRASALAAAPPLVLAIAAALDRGAPLPRAPITPLLFDDLNPALAAIVAHDATADEAIAGVARGWARTERTATVAPPDDTHPALDLQAPDPAPAGVFP